MQFKIKGILSYPHLFKPHAVSEGEEPKFSCSILLRKDDPQLVEVRRILEAEKAAKWPTGFPTKGRVFLKDCAEEFPGEPRIAGYMQVSGSARVESRPHVVDEQLQPVIDPSAACAGAVVWGAFNTFTYDKPVNKGVSAGLNGVMLTGQIGELGALDGRPSVDSLFGGTTAAVPQFAAPAAVPQFAAPAAVPQFAAPAAVPAPAPNPAILQVAPPARVMTPKAGGAPYEAFVAQGWTDDMLRKEGYIR